LNDFFLLSLIIDGKISIQDEKIKDAEENLGESELREALLSKAEYLSKIGDKVIIFIFLGLTPKIYEICHLSDKDAAIEAIRKTMEKTVGLGNRMDLIFHNIRLGLFYTDYSKLTLSNNSPCNFS